MARNSPMHFSAPCCWFACHVDALRWATTPQLCELAERCIQGLMNVLLSKVFVLIALMKSTSMCRCVVFLSSVLLPRPTTSVHSWAVVFADLCEHRYFFFKQRVDFSIFNGAFSSKQGLRLIQTITASIKFHNKHKKVWIVLCASHVTWNNFVPRYLQAG